MGTTCTTGRPFPCRDPARPLCDRPSGHGPRSLEPGRLSCAVLRMIAGLVPPTEGHVLKDGRRVDGPGRDRGMVFQSYTSFPWLTVEENVQFGFYLGSPECSSSEKRDKVTRLLDLVGM